MSELWPIIWEIEKQLYTKYNMPIPSLLYRVFTFIRNQHTIIVKYNILRLSKAQAKLKGGIGMSLFGGADDSLLFFFLLLVIIFLNCGLFDDGSELLFFFLLLVVLFQGESCGCRR